MLPYHYRCKHTLPLEALGLSHSYSPRLPRIILVRTHERVVGVTGKDARSFWSSLLLLLLLLLLLSLLCRRRCVCLPRMYVQLFCCCDLSNTKYLCWNLPLHRLHVFLSVPPYSGLSRHSSTCFKAHSSNLSIPSPFFTRPASAFRLNRGNQKIRKILNT